MLYVIRNTADWTTIVNTTLVSGDIVRVVDNIGINSDIGVISVPAGVVFNGNGFTIFVNGAHPDKSSKIRRFFFGKTFFLIFFLTKLINARGVKTTHS